MVAELATACASIAVRNTGADLGGGSPRLRVPRKPDMVCYCTDRSFAKRSHDGKAVTSSASRRHVLTATLGSWAKRRQSIGFLCTRLHEQVLAKKRTIHTQVNQIFLDRPTMKPLGRWVRQPVAIFTSAGQIDSSPRKRQAPVSSVHV